MSATSPSRSETPIATSDAEAPPPSDPSPTPTPGAVRRAPSWRRGTPRWHTAVEWGIRATALTAIIGVALVFLYIVWASLPLVFDATIRAEVTLRKMWTPQPWDGGPARWAWQPTSTEPKYGILPLLIGSLKVTIVALLVSTPIAVAAAVFTAHVAPRRLREFLKPAIELLAGVPSVVLGVFALLILATWFQSTFGFEHRLNAIVAGCALSLTIVPLIFTIAEDALTAVPKEMVDASLALGATRSHTILKVVVPAAIPGIAAGVVLGFGRAIGETMIVLMASGNAGLSEWTFGHSTRTITATIAQEMAEVVHGSPHYVVLFTLGATLMVFALITNIIAQRIVEKFRRARGGS